MKELAIQNRIDLLSARKGKDNGNIIKKLQRKLRQIQKTKQND